MADKNVTIGGGICVVLGRGAKGADGTGINVPGPYFDDAAAATGGDAIGSIYELAFPNAYDMAVGMTKIRRT